MCTHKEIVVVDRVRLLDKIQHYGDLCARLRAAEIDAACCQTGHDYRRRVAAEERQEAALDEIRELLGLSD